MKYQKIMELYYFSQNCNSYFKNSCLLLQSIILVGIAIKIFPDTNFRGSWVGLPRMQPGNKTIGSLSSTHSERFPCSTTCFYSVQRHASLQLLACLCFFAGSAVVAGFRRRVLAKVHPGTTASVQCSVFHYCFPIGETQCSSSGEKCCRVSYIAGSWRMFPHAL